MNRLRNALAFKRSIARRSITPLLCICTVAPGCSDFNVKRLQIGETKALATRADIRIITERPDPHPASALNILCAEPSPDVALALSRALSAEAHAKTPTGTEAGASGGFQMNQAALTLAGRTSAVVALRDGLFRACEGYANGIIGRDSYALILSQYGDLLVTLILGDAAATNEGGGYRVTSKASVPTDKDPSPSAPAAPAKPAAPDKPVVLAPSSSPSTNAAPAAKVSTAVYKPSDNSAEASGKTMWLANSVAAPASAIILASSPGPKVKKPATPAPKQDELATLPKAAAPAALSDTSVRSAAEGIAVAYFDGERDRLVKAMFVVCAAEAEQRHEKGVHFPALAPAKADYFDRMCEANLHFLAEARPAAAPKP